MNIKEAKEVETAFINLLTILRTNLLSLPSKYAPQLEGQDRRAIYSILTSELEQCLMELSSFDLTKLISEENEDED